MFLTTELVEDSLSSAGTDEGSEDICTWCDRSLGYAKLIYKTVCIDCHDRLKGANVPDSEIFG